MFETATRKKLRFSTPRGLVSVEDLWDLPLTSTSKVDLDTVAKTIHKGLREAEEESFVTASSGNPVEELKLEIVKHIISIKMAEAEARKDAKAKKEKEQFILGVIAEKEMDELKSKPIEELRKELDK